MATVVFAVAGAYSQGWKGSRRKPTIIQVHGLHYTDTPEQAVSAVRDMITEWNARDKAADPKAPMRKWVCEPTVLRIPL